MFTTETNLVMELGVHSSVYAICPQQIIQAISEFPWSNRLPNTSINEQVQLFTQTNQNHI